MMKKILVAAITPHIDDDLLVGEDSESWPILIPEALEALRLGDE